MQNTKIQQFFDMCHAAEKQIEHFNKEISQLKALDKKVAGELQNCEDIIALKSENARLKFQHHHLKKNIEATLDNKSNFSPSLIFMLSEVFNHAMHIAYPSSINEVVNIQNCGSQSSFGDYQCNSVMGLYKHMKANKAGVELGSKTLKDVAEDIVNSLMPLAKMQLMESVKVQNPAFINITLSKSLVNDVMTHFLHNGIQAPFPGLRQRIIVDLSSPNIAKEMHVGHLRSTIIGDSVCRLLEYLGHDVLRLNHIGDWGTQFGMLIAHLQEKFPDYLKTSPPIGDLQAFYKESKVRFDNDEQFKKKAYEDVVKLQSKDPTIMAAWKLICDESIKELQVIYDMLDIKLLHRGESFYQDMMKEMIPELQARGVLVNEDGRLVMFVKDFTVPLIVQKSDGGYTYDTSDLASIRHRIQSEKGDRLVYVVDSGQGLHFQTLFQACKDLGWTKPDTIMEHAAFGVVLGEDKKKFKTRSGETIRLHDLIAEGLRRTEAKLVEKGRDKVLNKEEFKAAKEAVAFGCIKYADLSNNRTKDYVFSFDKMLDDRGNTAAYLLYAYTRIRSIARAAGFTSESLKEMLKDPAKFSHFELRHEKELKLGKALCRFGEVILQVQESLYLHTLCDYLYELSSIFTEFYDNCYCIEKDTTGKIVKINHERLAICEVTANVMAKCFYILGIVPIEKM